MITLSDTYYILPVKAEKLLSPSLIAKEAIKAYQRSLIFNFWLLFDPFGNPITTFRGKDTLKIRVRR